MLRPILDVVTALNKVKAACCSVVVPTKMRPLLSNRRPGIAASFRKQFEGLGSGWYHQIAWPRNSMPLRGPSSCCLGRHRASRQVPAETVCHGVSIFEAKAGKADFGIAVGDIVLVASG